MGRLAANGARGGRLALAVAAAWFGLAIGWPATGLAQSGTAASRPTALERLGPVSPQKRADLQRLLDEHAAVLESQALVLKTVAKLIGPTVVHLEADTPRRSVQAYGQRHNEEAGSGVVIHWKG